MSILRYWGMKHFLVDPQYHLHEGAIVTINDSPARGRCQHLFAAFLFGKKNAQNKSYNIILRSAMVLEENVQGTLWKSHDKLLLRAIVF